VSWRTILWRALREFYDRQMTQHAAAMSYYAMLSLFPALLIAVALLGVFGQEQTVTDITAYLARHGAPEAVLAPVRSLLASAIDAGSGAVSATLVASVSLSMLGASGAFASARRALNAVYEVEEDRALVHRKLADIGATLLLIVLGLIALVFVFLGGGVANDLFSTLGWGHQAASAWQILRWPSALGVTLVAYAFIYAHGPDIEPRQWHTFSPGALVAVPVWLLVSYGLWWWVTHLADLKAYGTFGSAVVLLLWLFVSNSALLFGAELNAQLSIAKRAAGTPQAPVPPQRHEPASGAA
jgi:membrane protein